MEQARVKGCGKSTPAFEAIRVARQPPLGARSSVEHGSFVPVARDGGSSQVDCIDGWSSMENGNVFRNRTPPIGQLTYDFLSKSEAPSAKSPQP